jgi:alpha-tubulin suppressor-like RCC1 family protein
MIPSLSSFSFAGQCGSDSSGVDVLTPTKVNSPLKFKAVAAGYGFTCAISTEATDNGYCWGDSSWGSLGNGSKTPNQSSPVKISGGHTWKMLKAGESHICGINSADALFCWGGRKQGVFGDGFNRSLPDDGISTPLEMIIGSLDCKTWKTVATAGYHVCALTLSGETWCWGLNNSGEVSGVPETAPATMEPPSQLTTNLSFETIIGLWYGTCGVTFDGEVYCFGNKLYTGGCGSDTCSPVRALVPYKLPTATGTVKDVSKIGSSTGASGWSLCVIDSLGQV